MKILLACLLFILITQITHPQTVDKKLTKEIKSITANFDGEVGVYIKDLKKNKIVDINASSIFPTASLIKIPILIGIMDKINKNELQYYQVFTYHDSMLYEGEDILGSFKSGEKIALSKLIMLMLSMSDNTASLWLQRLGGTGIRINTLMDSIGLQHTRVNSRTPGRVKEKTLYGWGQTTPKEMAQLLGKIYKVVLLSPAASDRMLRSLNRNYWDRESISQIPPYATVFSKSGAVDGARSEVVLVKGKKATYVFCVATKNNNDESWQASNEAWTMIRKISAHLWNYFEPKDDWQPPANADFF